MTFELMPNETLIECFQYLNGVDIFYSFDQLNNRFSKLIRSIPLHLNFYQLKKSLYHQFCQSMISNPKMKQKIVSLQLSNEYTNGQISFLLSLFSLNEFTHLRSLKLFNLHDDNVQRILPMLPCLFNLHSFSYTCQENGSLQMMDVIPKLNTRILSISEFNILSRVTRKTMLHIISLNINQCVVEDLFHLFQCTMILKYLRIQYFHHDDAPDNMILINMSSLNHFIINDFQIKDFETIEFLLTKMSNLTFLSISSSQCQMINAFRWQNLITNSLNHLHTFRFCFDYVDNNRQKMNEIIRECQAFQTTFWYEHHCFTNYEIDEFRLLVFTTPYIRKQYELFPVTRKFIYEFNHTSLFDNVTHLILHKDSIQTRFHYFPNVTSLTFKSSYYCPLSTDDLIENLYEIINPSNIKHLTIEGGYDTSIEKIINQLTNMNSLTTRKTILLSLLENQKLWETLNKKIINLNISDGYLFTDNDVEHGFLNSIHMIFSNIERLECDLTDVDVLIFFLTSCSKLSMISLGYISREIHSWIESNASSFDIYFDFKWIK
ncbi:hypothetical protein I4U23_010617 [Adineta vaga]|nr:hypothetical protein I4U23_010617 [Adineta vaga]